MTFKTTCSVAVLLSITCGGLLSAQTVKRGDVLVATQGPPGPPGPPGPVGPAGAPGTATGYEIVQKTGTALPGRLSLGVALCPGGKKAMGGGLSQAATAAGSLVLTQSYPDAGGAGWSVFFKNDSTEPLSYIVYAVCITWRPF